MRKRRRFYVNYYEAFARNSYRFLTDSPAPTGSPQRPEGIAGAAMEGPTERAERATLVGASASSAMVIPGPPRTALGRYPSVGKGRAGGAGRSGPRQLALLKPPRRSDKVGRNRCPIPPQDLEPGA